MLVDMAGSENIEQAGQTGLEAKMQVGNLEILVFPSFEYGLFAMYFRPHWLEILFQLNDEQH